MYFVPPMLTTELTEHRGTVLVVDDSAEMRRYFRRLLELDRFEVETATDGDEALALLNQGLTPRLVLLDLQMPHMDGLTTLRHLRDLYPGLPVIICSGEEDEVKIQHAEMLGAKAYIRKPVQHLYLSAAMEWCLGADHPAPESLVEEDLIASVIMFPAASVV